MQQCFIILKLLSENHYYGAETLFPLTQYSTQSIVIVTLHHLQRKRISDVICYVMFSVMTVHIFLYLLTINYIQTSMKWVTCYIQSL